MSYMALPRPLQSSRSRSLSAGPSEVGTRRPAGRDIGAFSRLRPLLAAVSLALLASAPGSNAQATVEPVPDFLLRDVNPNSPRNTKMVSPRDYRLQISAFYFGAAG